MPATHIEKSFYTTREAAALLGVSVGTVQLWAEHGPLKAWKTAGGHRRVLRDSLERLLHDKVSKVSEEADAATPVAPVLRRLNVLVLEDDPGLMRLYQTRMSGWSMKPEVTVVNSAVAMLLQVGHKVPDLLVVGLQIPDMAGFSLLRVLCETPEVANTTIVIVSGQDAPALARQHGLPPTIEILSKPIPFDRLLVIATGIVNQNSLSIQSDFNL